MKKHLLFIAALLALTAAKAQTNYNFARFGVGVETSITRAYTNVNIQDNNQAYNFNVNYYYTPFFSSTLAFQSGRLSGGSTIYDPNTRQYLNNYKAVVFHTDLEMGEIIDYGFDPFLNVIKNFYIGTGIAFISSNLKVQRYSLNDPAYIFPGSDQSTNVAVPLRLGYEIKLFNPYGEPFIRLGIGYEHTVVFGGGLDGYNDPSRKFKNSALDQYREITVGIKLCFGNVTSYDRAQ